MVWVERAILDLDYRFGLTTLPPICIALLFALFAVILSIRPRAEDPLMVISAISSAEVGLAFPCRSTVFYTNEA